MLATMLASALTVLAPARDVSGEAEPTTSRGFDRLPGFNAIVSAHVETSLGPDALPVGSGSPLERGLFVTIGPERVWAYDVEIATMTGGVFTEKGGAPECDGRCPASLFTAMRGLWLSLAIESTQRAVEIPARLAVLAHRNVLARTMLQVVYATAASRPVRPPDLALVVAGAGRGLQSQIFHVLPPGGLELSQGSAALGLRVEFGRNRYSITAADQRYVQDASVADLARLRAVLAGVKKHHPGKEAIILEPDSTVTIADLVAVIAAVRADFPRIVLSLGQDVDLP
jgi:hypothetical protein